MNLLLQNSLKTRSWDTVSSSASDPATSIQNKTEESKQIQQKQRGNQVIRSHMSKRTSSNSAPYDDEDDGNTDFDGYNDNSPDHMGIADDDMSQLPIAKSLPSNFMFRGMRGQRPYDVPQIGKYSQ